METKQKTTTGQIIELDDTIHFLGCGCEMLENCIKFKCGNKINGFLFFCDKCNNKKDLRR